MPNIKSAEKRVSVSSAKKLQNQMVKSQMNTAIKKFNAAIAANDVELAEKLLSEAASKIDNAASKKVIHKNSANHKKAQIGKALFQLKSGIIVVKADAKSLKQAEQKAAAARKAEEKAAAIAAWKEEKAAKEAAKEAAKDPKAAKKAAKKSK
ncbi:MAG: 30S ribosomal protein S20 [Clostridia bacterium]|nr:30S ribosomal protein S20 [Clostridia bacterium]